MRGVLSLCFASLLVATLAARERPLPAFTVTAPDGRSAASGELWSEGRWLLVYVTPQCPACDRLLDALGTWALPAGAARTVVVVRAPLDAAGSYLAQHLPLESDAIAWFADPDGRTGQALGTRWTPALAGIEAGRIAWQIAGVLNDPAAVEPVIRTWLER
ncbi:MAG TPA: hypothetical protein VNI83_01855 [Vicinamibacterales bacterium]|nr:hypothetical protein [Vicinamibacterales bacterium]